MRIDNWEVFWWLSWVANCNGLAAMAKEWGWSGMLKLLLLDGVVPSPVSSTVRAAGRPTTILSFWLFYSGSDLEAGFSMSPGEKSWWVVFSLLHLLKSLRVMLTSAHLKNPNFKSFWVWVGILDLGMVDADCRWWMVSPLASAAQSGRPDGRAPTSDTRGVSRRVMDTPAFSPHTNDYQIVKETIRQLEKHRMKKHVRNDDCSGTDSPTRETKLQKCNNSISTAHTISSNCTTFQKFHFDRFCLFKT